MFLYPNRPANRNRNNTIIVYQIQRIKSCRGPRQPNEYKEKKRAIKLHIPYIAFLRSYIVGVMLVCLYDLAKGRNQRLSQPEAENELGSGHQKLRRQTLEERRETFVLHHVGDDTEARLGVLEVAVLDASLDHVEGSGNDKRCASTADGGDEVLRPRGLVVVLQSVDVFLGESRSTEKLP